MNTFINGLRAADNYKLTENCGLAHKSTLNGLYDLYALGGAYRNRSDYDCILLFKKAFEQDETVAMRCLFYLRDITQGQGERRFFRVCLKWLGNEHPDAARRNLEYVSEFGRWDDIFALMGTKVENDVVRLVRKQLEIDLESLEVPNGAVSLLGKWLPSINTSSETTRATARHLCTRLGFTQKQYRKICSALRERINVLERLMSASQWDKIDFSKIPSQAGLKYRKAFERHDIERKKSGATTYEDFMTDENTTVNAKALAPYEVVEKAINLETCHYDYKRNTCLWSYHNPVERAAINKYWDNLHDYFNGMPFNGLCVVDTSGSMHGTPINVAISLGLYCAEKAKGPFANHYISFASSPQLIETSGVDFVDKVQRIYQTNLCDDTNLEAVFELLLDTAIESHCSQEDLPQTIAVISDMEINHAQGYYRDAPSRTKTMMEKMRVKWAQNGYEMPNLVYWNVDARSNTFLDDGPNITYISGFSASIFEQLMTGKTGIDLMMEKLNSKRYEMIH